MTKTSPKSPKSASNSSKNAPQGPKTALQGEHPPKQAHTPLFVNWPVWALILALIGVVGGTTLFILAATGVFSDKKATLSPEYYASTSTLTLSDDPFIELLDHSSYQSLVDQHESFVVFVDQAACSNADRLRGYISNYSAETGLLPYRIMFSDLKSTPLYDSVKYYPSVVVVSGGEPIQWLRADADEDTEEYNDYASFKTWLDSALK